MRPSPQMQPRPAVFFDRDGIVNRSPGAGYVERPEDFHILPEFFEALRIATARGYPAVVVTNQRGVSLGRVSPSALEAMHDRLRAALAERGLALLDIRVCASGDNADPRRKPNPGMLLEAAAAHALDLARSWMIGDSERDIEAGRRAGCAVTVRVAEEGTPTSATWKVADMAELARLLEQRLPPLE